MKKKNQEWPTELVGEIFKEMALPYLKEFLYSIVRQNEFRYQNLVSKLESEYGKKRASEIIKRIRNSNSSWRCESPEMPELSSLAFYIRLREKILKYLSLNVEKERYGGEGIPK